MDRLFKRERTPSRELPTYVLQEAYKELTEEIREKQVLQLELYHEIQSRLEGSDAPMEEVSEIGY